MATVWRDGIKMDVDAKTLVPGDIIEIQTGQQIPADIVLIRTYELFVNNAQLTGESENLLRDTYSKELNIFESRNVAFAYTRCMGGSGIGIVIKTGNNTVMALVSNLSSSQSLREPPMTNEFAYYIRSISAISLISGLLVGYFNISS